MAERDTALWFTASLCVDYIHLLDGTNSLMLLRCELESDWGPGVWRGVEEVRGWGGAGTQGAPICRHVERGDEIQFSVCVPFHQDGSCLTTHKSRNLYPDKCGNWLEKSQTDGKSEWSVSGGFRVASGGEGTSAQAVKIYAEKNIQNLSDQNQPGQKWKYQVVVTQCLWHHLFFFLSFSLCLQPVIAFPSR